jgi:hypothetical protein
MFDYIKPEVPEPSQSIAVTPVTTTPTTPTFSTPPKLIIPAYTSDELFELQQLQLSDLVLSTSPPKHAEPAAKSFDLSMLRSRLDSTDLIEHSCTPETETSIAEKTPFDFSSLRQQPETALAQDQNLTAVSETEETFFPFCEADSDDEFIANTVGHDVSESQMYETYYSRLSQSRTLNPVEPETEDPPTFDLFGTNPPDLTSPIMRSSFCKKWR